MITSESPRWDLGEFFDDDGYEEPSEIHFLGGCKIASDENDYDLYLVRWDDDENPTVAIWAARKDEDEDWDTYDEETDDIDGNSVALLIEGLDRAKANGLLQESDPMIDTRPEGSTLRHYLPAEQPKGRIVEREAVFLGGTRVNHVEYELFYVSKSETPRAHAIVFALRHDTENEFHLSQWEADGSVPSGRGERKALNEAIRRARAQGFEYQVHKDYLSRLDERTGTPVSVERPTSSLTTNTGDAAQMTTTERPKPKNFTHVTVAPSRDEQIHIPAGMSKSQAREILTTIEKNEEQLINWSEVIDAYPLDGAFALRRVLDRRFGGAVKAGATQRTFFGDREVPPFMISVEVGVDKTEHVPWGHFTIPLMEHKIHAGVEFREKQLFFKLSGEIKRKYQPTMDEIAAQVREELRAGSIYKGKAFRVRFPTDADMQNDGYDPDDYAPRFINVAAPQDQLILSEAVQLQINVNLFTPVRQTEVCRKMRIPLKRGVLLEGKYGTGKTLTAAMLSRECVDNGWTFIYLTNVRDLEKAMRFAKRYEPAVIFAEDIDAVLVQNEGSKRDQAMNDILNTIDGVDMKGAEQMVVLTTNFVDRINKAMLRPGRLDAVISITPPDEVAAIRLMKHYAVGLLDTASDASLLPAAEMLAGQIPAVIREVVERSKLAAIYRAGASEKLGLVGEDLRVAAEGILSHIKLLEDPPADTRSDLEKAADRLGAHLTGAAAQTSTKSTAPVKNGKHASTTNV